MKTSSSLTPLPYAVRQGHPPQPFDEMVDLEGAVRPHWGELREFFDQVGADEITRRWGEAERMVRDYGMVSHEEGRAKSAPRLWRLDPIPLSLSSMEWTHIEQAVVQRARLLNLLLQDVYGKQQTLERGYLPPEVILYNPHYLRPSHGLPVVQNQYLHLYAADLARSPDGRWWVLSDRTQAPAGLGYLMQNRIILSRVFPEPFRSGRVRRLAWFFRAWQEALAGCSPRQGVEPRIVLLTPGPFHETYFEHVFISRYLGYPLVQGADLVVREGKVYLKTLRGLNQVDVILRRVDDDCCDPLELGDNWLLGVPGLLSALRQGSVVMVNALGSGVVETPALNPFLPRLCQELLGEELLLPPVATWWCGQSEERRHVLENLGKLILRGAFADSVLTVGERLDPEQRAGLRQRIEERPRQFVAQEHVQLSQAPVWHGNRLHPRSVVLRVFAAFNGVSFFVLPAALCRAVRAPRSYDVSVRSGGLTKDVWVQADGEGEQHTALSVPPAVTFRRGSADLPSRTADQMFWVGRYAERAEFTCRLVRSAVFRLTLEQGWAEVNDILPLLRTLAQQEQLSFEPDPAAPQQAIERELALTVLDAQRPGSVKTIIGQLKNNATGVRDRLSQDTWRTLSQLNDLLVWPQREALPLAELLPVLHACLLRLSAFAGQVKENMTEGLDLRFLELGRFLERAIYTGRLVLETLPPGSFLATGRHEVLLETLDSLITYRQRYFHPQLFPLLDLLLADETNPRSLASQLRQIEVTLAALPGEDAGHYVRTEEKLIHEGLSRIRLLTWDPREPRDTVTRLSRILESVEDSLSQATDLLTHRYFSHARLSANTHLSISAFPQTS